MRKSSITGLATMALLAAGSSTVALAQAIPAADGGDFPYRNVSLPAETRAADIVSRMTLAEKAAQLKDEAPAIPRLGVPAYAWWSEGLHGVARAGEATVFPQAIGLAATWDAPLVRQTADIISTEFRAKYLDKRGLDGSSSKYRGLTVWSPNVNIFRDPRWGRGQETFGEDPYLTSRLGVAFIGGLQGLDPAHPKTIAAVKHFAVHSGPEADRHRDDIHPSAHDLEDTYLPAFRAAVVEAKAQGLMCAYNAVDGVPACASPLIQSRVRQQWGFKGHVVSDCAAVADIFQPAAHHYTRTAPEAVAAAVNAGTDLICAEFGPDRGSNPQTVVDAVEQGLLKRAVLDRAVTRLFEARFRLGLLDQPAVGAYAAITSRDFNTPGHIAKSLEVARASMVLLKNDGLLPLKTSPKRIAVIGPNADSIDALVGNYNGTPSDPITLLTGLRQRFPSARIDYVEGTGLVGVPLKPVPTNALCVDAACEIHGVKIEEFADTTLGGQPVRSETSAAVKFSWGRPERRERTTSIRWSGFLTAAENGPYRFRLNGDGGYRIRVNDTTVVDAWDAADPSSIADGEIMLKAGERYRFAVEAIQTGPRGDQSLEWSNFNARAEAAVSAAKAADVVIFAGGLTAKLEGEEMRVRAPGFAGGDRTSLDLPTPQQKLLEQLQATGKPLVLVLMNGSALGVEWAQRNVSAIVEAWYPGGSGGRAIAELIAGDYSPAGRLPVTFYRSAEQLPPFKSYDMKGRTYRYFDGDALYPFGYGLSYTRFSYDVPTLARRTIQAGDTASLSVRLKNIGSRSGDEVVQVYGTQPSPGAPKRALMSFKRIHLKPGEARTVSFDIDARTMSSVSPEGQRRVSAGTLSLYVGGGQPDEQPYSGAVPRAAQLRIVGSRPLD
jgi:beta-glucosidase